MKKILFALLIFITTAVSAQNISLTDTNDIPIELSAEGGIEFNQNKSTVTASKNVTLTKADINLTSDTLTAFFNDNKKITKIIASGNVEITSAEETVMANTITYTLTNEKISVEGSPARLIYKDDEISAENGITFNRKTGIATAKSAAITQKPSNRTLSANVITAHFNNQNTPAALEKAEASGNVKIVNDDQIITGEKGMYNVSKNEARLIGNISIEQENTHIGGGEIIVNFDTGISKILPGKSKDVKAEIEK
jgi:lipopolysaccharide transport protein LptA